MGGFKYVAASLTASTNTDKNQDLEKGSRVFHGARRIIERNGIVGIFFEDIRDAWLFQNQTSSSNFDWQVTHVGGTDKEQIRCS